MKEILNKTARPVRVPLPGGKVLHLGPRAVAQISDGATELKSVRELIDAGTIEIVGDGERAPTADSPQAQAERTNRRSTSPRTRGRGDR